jgi:hypothetical protein
MIRTAEIKGLSGLMSCAEADHWKQAQAFKNEYE